MATTNKGLNLPAAGSTAWNVPINANTDILDKAFGSFTTVTTTTGVYDFTASDVQNMCIKSTTSAFVSNVTYRIPATIAGQWVIQNQSGASTFTLTVSNAAGGTSVTIPRGTVRSIYSDGTNVIYADTPLGGDSTNVTISGTLNVDGNTTLGGTITLKGALLDSVASQAQAESGADNTCIMTPLRTRQSISTAPSLNTSAVLAGVSNASVNASASVVGAYVYAVSNVDGLNTGDGISGSNLAYCLIYDITGTSYVGLRANNSLTGSWRLMSGNFVPSDVNCGLFLRYA